MMQGFMGQHKAENPISPSFMLPLHYLSDAGISEEKL